MGALSGYLALGVAVRNDVFIECQSYGRVPFTSAVDGGGDPTHQTQPPIPGVTGFDVDDHVTVGAIFDTPETGTGHCLGWWEWKPAAAELPGTWPQLDVIMLFSHVVTLAINGSRTTGRAADLEIARGSVIGSMNGNPVVAGVRLLVVDGKLIARAMAPKARPAAVA